ncbi:peptidoglycan-binding protein [Kitasatospora sp. NPDC057936]|uniref:peptidoglycan-binding protein n=1 Tax=Kitasatospora sp. NPDC057936 TaxID=3346283 RepID=UPI0036DBC7B0
MTATTMTAGGADDDVADPPAGPSRGARRRRVLVGVAVAAALVAVGGLGAAAFVKSPAERAARTAPPPESLLTAPVVSQVLTRSVTARAVVYPPAQYDVVPSAASPEITRLFVSKLGVRTGDTAAAGRLLAEVSGQPLFALPGPVPAYRDVKPGATGPDVAELQDALSGLGHPIGDDDKGTFGPGTAAAVTAFYRGLGYPVPTTGATTQQAVDTAQKAVDADRRTVDGLTERKRAGATRAPAPAPAATPATPATPPATGPGTDIDIDIDIDQQLAATRKQLAADQVALEKARAVNGPMVPAAHVLFLPVLPAAVTAVNGSVGSPAAGTLLSLTSGGLDVTGQLTPGQAAGVKPGMAAEILAEDTGTTVSGTVTEVGAPTTAPPAGRVITLGGGAAAPGGAPPGGPGTVGGATGGAAGAPPNNAAGTPSYIPVTITPSGPLPPALNGKNVRLTIRRDAASAPVTAVPVAAVSTDAAGRTSVTRVDAAGTRTTVPVSTGVSADGMVAVTPADGAGLRPGDRVVVGK